jgi:hypothetical protein
VSDVEKAEGMANAFSNWVVRAAVVLTCALVLALPATAFIPKAKRIVDAVAETNAASKRATALRFELSMRIGDGEPIATGELITHPTGLARLELQGTRGLVERHLLQGSEHTAARDGELVENPRAFLPPLFLLQADSPAILNAALSSLGVREGVVGLAPCGEGDCFVLGESAGASRVAEAGAAARDSGRDPLELDASTTRAPAVWVDAESFEIRGIDSQSGVRVRLGPVASFDKVRAPRWWIIEEPEKRPVRFEIGRVMLVNAPAAVFSKAWLMAPAAPVPPSAEDPAPEEPTP